MADVREATEEFLAEKPHLESEIESLLNIDESGPWEFQDVPLDSGAFGEIVSRGIVEERDGGYRLVDRAAVRAVLDGEETTETAEGSSTRSLSEFELPTVGVESKHALALTLALGLVVGLRVLFVSSVFRNGDVVLGGNDPWGYRFWVEVLLSADVSPLALGSLPEAIGSGLSADYLYLITAWWTALLFGGTPHAAGAALSWLPVVFAALTGGFVYSIAVRLTADRRIGLASVVMLAVTPAHAFRTMIGFGDHHAFDYLLLSMVVYALVVIATDQRTRTVDIGPRSFAIPDSTAVWAGAVLLGVSVSSHSLAWRAGPLLYLPIGGYAVYRAVSDVRVGQSPLARNLPLVGGLGVASLLTVLPPSLWNWSISWLRTFAPSLLLGGTLVVLVVGEAGYRLDLSPRSVAVGGMITGTVSAIAAWVLLPQFSLIGSRFVGYLQRTGESNISETVSLFSGDIGSFVGPLLFLGFTLYLAVPYAALALWRAYDDHSPAWTVAGIFFTYFLAWSMIQVRFAGQLAVLAAVFAGIGFVRLADAIDILETGRVFGDRTITDASISDGGRRGIRTFGLPDRTTLVALGVLFLLIASIGLVQIPVKQSQLVVDDETYRTATWIESYAEQQKGDVSNAYVFSLWSRNRVYNYLLSGDSESYGFAQNNFGEFLRSTDPGEWYERLGDRVDFIVTQPVESGPDSIQTRLHQNLGSASQESPGLAHYRVVHVTDNKSRVVSTLVPGTTIVGEAEPDSEISITNDVNLSGATTEYRRRAKTNPYGIYSVTVPYPGRYTLPENSTVVSDSDINNGVRSVTHDREGLAHWPFDAGAGQYVYDRVGGYRGNISEAEWVSGVQKEALSFDGEDTTVQVQDIQSPQREFTISLWVKPNKIDTTEKNDFRYLLQTAKGRMLVLEENGGISFWVPGAQDTFDAETFLNAGSVSVGTWSHIVVSYDDGVRQLYINGELVREDQIKSDPTNWGQELFIGGDSSREHRFNGKIDEIRIYSHDLNSTEVDELHSRVSK